MKSVELKNQIFAFAQYFVSLPKLIFAFIAKIAKINSAKICFVKISAHEIFYP